MKGYNVPVEVIKPEFTPAPPDNNEEETIKKFLKKRKTIDNVSNYLADHYWEIYRCRRDKKEQRVFARRILHYALEGYRK